MRKRILAALLCACLLVPALTAPAFAAFPDVPADEWYTEYVDFCTEKGIVNGFEDGTFRPTGYLRRSEFIKMLATSATLSYKSELPGKHWELVAHGGGVLGDAFRKRRARGAGHPLHVRRSAGKDHAL